jgi:hypothetical protein
MTPLFALTFFDGLSCKPRKIKHVAYWSETYLNGIFLGTVINLVVNRRPSVAMKRNCMKVTMFPLLGYSLKRSTKS